MDSGLGAFAPARNDKDVPQLRDNPHASSTAECSARRQPRLPPRKRLEAVAHPIDHQARCGVALQMVLHQKPDVAASRQLRRAQSSVGQQFGAEIVGNDADGPFLLYEILDHEDVFGYKTLMCRKIAYISIY